MAEFISNQSSNNIHSGIISFSNNNNGSSNNMSPYSTPSSITSPISESSSGANAANPMVPFSQRWNVKLIAKYCFLGMLVFSLISYVLHMLFALKDIPEVMAIRENKEDAKTFIRETQVEIWEEFVLLNAFILFGFWAAWNENFHRLMAFVLVSFLLDIIGLFAPRFEIVTAITDFTYTWLSFLLALLIRREKDIPWSPFI